MHLEERSLDLKTLAGLASIQLRDQAQMEADFQAHYEATKHARPHLISVVDRDGAVVYASRAQSATPSQTGCDYFEWARQPKNRGKVFVSSTVGQTQGQTALLSGGGALLATPLYWPDSPSSPAGPARSWSGVLVMTVDLEPTLAAHLSALTVRSGSHRVWIMDRDGTILLQSEHPEMTRENIHQTNPQCAQCHVSFDYARKMLAGGAGIEEYQLKGRPKKLAAFALVRFANASWIVVVNAPQEEVTAFVRRSYVRTLWLLGIIVAAVSLVAVMVHRTNLRRVQAEADARQWRERHRLEETIRRAEEGYRTLFEQSFDGILIMDPETTRPIEFNEAAHRRLGYAREEFARLRLSDYAAMETPEAAQVQLDQLRREGRACFETRHRSKQGEIRNVEVIAQTLELAERKVLHCIYHDITEHKRAEAALQRNAEQIRQDAATKTTLLHEVNHRVKNSLMRLAEIVRLEREQAPPSADGLSAVLRDLESRLQGMAVLHTLLSDAQWRPLPLSDLVTQIVTAALIGSPIRERIRVSVAAPAESLWVVPEQATAVAVILNELATNSVKHAFRGRDQGCLEVRLRVLDRPNGQTQVGLEFRDDGPGWPAPVLNGERRRVGLHLIEASVRSPLRGQLTLRNDAGAAAEITFRLAAAG
jgi:PAS domain S-box-containing protein